MYVSGFVSGMTSTEIIIVLTEGAVLLLLIIVLMIMLCRRCSKLIFICCAFYFVAEGSFQESGNEGTFTCNLYRPQLNVFVCI